MENSTKKHSLFVAVDVTITGHEFFVTKDVLLTGLIEKAIQFGTSQDCEYWLRSNGLDRRCRAIEISYYISMCKSI